MHTPKPHPEDQMLAAEIAASKDFTAFIRLSPGEKHCTRGLTSYADALAEAERLTAAFSHYGRRAVVYAISSKGYSLDVSPRLAKLAGLAA